MKLLKLTTVYPGYAQSLYAAHPGLAEKSYDQQAGVLFHDAFSWSDSWKVALAPQGIDVMEVTANVEPLQRAWARENMAGKSAGADLATIAVQQVLKFGPDVLWFDDHDADLLQRIREAVRSIKLVLGWTGSAIPRQNAFRYCDVILSCSRESTELLAKQGYRTAEVHHGFDERILSRLKPASPMHEIIFIGQLLRGTAYHVGREKLLEDLVGALPLRIFSPMAHPTLSGTARAVVKRGMNSVYRLMERARMGGVAASMLRAAGRNREWLEPSTPSINPKLIPHMDDGIYGLRMYQTIRDSHVTLNIHADSSDRYASNMRLFEVTGVGGCLLTDWKPNLGEIFEIDKEVVAYRSTGECIEKARWLLEHPVEAAAIARAGQERTLNEHGYFNRAQRLRDILRSVLGNDSPALQ